MIKILRNDFQGTTEYFIISPRHTVMLLDKGFELCVCEADSLPTFARELEADDELPWYAEWMETLINDGDASCVLQELEQIAPYAEQFAQRLVFSLTKINVRQRFGNVPANTLGLVSNDIALVSQEVLYPTIEDVKRTGTETEYNMLVRLFSSLSRGTDDMQSILDGISINHKHRQYDWVDYRDLVKAMAMFKRLNKNYGLFKVQYNNSTAATVPTVPASASKGASIRRGIRKLQYF